ncbi:MAG TPA: hypothetical protein VFJ94_09475, partial [Intrasporangium sp.]|uniref:hypothetical protein n=1 Tax=Intrasporangium sp. TaxID=1925024 RepID=UPI002D786ACB
MFEPMAAVCPRCDRPVALVVKGQWALFQDDWDFPLRWTAGHCPACSQALLLIQEQYYDDWDAPAQIYPPMARRLGTEIPKALRDDFEEARTTLGAKAYNSSVLMARRVLEG